MNDDRIDDLLEQTLANGAIPADATTAERAELESLLRTMGVLQSARAEASTEARATIPTARARFQRYVAANQPAPVIPQVATSAPRPGFFGRLVGRAGVTAMAGSAAGIGVLALAAVVLWQVAFNSPTSAYAQVVDPGDYVQVEGVIETSSDGVLQLKSELGDVEVAVSESTTLVEDSAAQDVSRLKPGDRVLVGGIAGSGRTLAAQTLALSGDDGQKPRVINFRRLDQLRHRLEGEVVTYAISSDGTTGAVLIQTPSGERFLVRVDGKSAAQLLTRASTALGQRVVVQQGAGKVGTFSLDVGVETPPAGTATAPAAARKAAFVSVRGVVISVEAPAVSAGRRIIEGTVTIQTLRGPVTVIVRPNASVLVGETGLTLGAGGRGEVAGHTISVSGGIDKHTGNVIADVIILGPKLERPQR